MVDLSTEIELIGKAAASAVALAERAKREQERIITEREAINKLAELHKDAERAAYEPHDTYRCIDGTWYYHQQLDLLLNKLNDIFEQHQLDHACRQWQSFRDEFAGNLRSMIDERGGSS